eukprot:g1563.t1
MFDTGQAFFTVVGIVGLTLLFSTSGWGLHLHHYFIALMCYLASRGKSNCSAVARALCLGALINGLSHWGETYQIPIWTEGTGWYPPSGNVDAGAWGNDDQVILTAAERVNQSEEILLRWAFVKDLISSNCSLDPQQERSVPKPKANNIPVYQTLRAVVKGTCRLRFSVTCHTCDCGIRRYPCNFAPQQDSSIFVVEMNHIEIYRGPQRSLRFLPPAPVSSSSSSSSVFVRVGRVSPGLSRQVISATQVLALRATRTGPALTWPYASTTDDCEKATVIVQQPSSTLEGYL